MAKPRKTGLGFSTKLKLAMLSCFSRKLTPYDRDLNVGINIKNRAVGHSVLEAHRLSEGIAGVGEKPTVYALASP